MRVNCCCMGNSLLLPPLNVTAKVVTELMRVVVKW